MIEIKFRAWDKVGKKMWKVSSMKFFGEKGNFDLQVEGNENEEWKEEPEFIIMQYTGMKDKNEREIYEGDILKRIDGLKVLIKWSEDSHGFEWYSLDIPTRYWNSDSSQWELSEIVGNIYGSLT